MRRWFLALGVLLAGSAVSSYADYVVIKINLGYVKQQKDEGLAGQTGQPGQLGQPGGQLGQAGGRAGALGNAPGGIGAGPGGRGFGGGPGGLGAQGQGLGAGGGRGFSGKGLTGGPPGLGGGQLGAGGGGFGGFRGGFGAPPPGRTEEDEEESDPLIVTGVVEVEHSLVKMNRSTHQPYYITHKWGQTQLYYQPGEVKYEVIEVPTVNQQFYAERHIIKDDASDKADRLIGLARWCVEHGMLDQVDGLIEEISKVDPQNATVATFNKMRAAMDGEFKQDDAALEWRDKLGDFSIASSKHYTLLHALVKTSAEPQARLDKLENNYRGFFYWFALRNHELPVPKQRLVAVLEPGAQAFAHAHDDIFDETSLVVDGFYSSRENLLFLSSTCLDKGYEMLNTLYKNSDFPPNIEELFTKHPKMKDRLQLGRASTWALVRRIMEEDSERAAITNEGSKQLLRAVGLWTRTVDMPEWLDFGIGSVFENPAGAFWSGIGTPNVNYHRDFLRWERDTSNTKFERDALTALKNVVTNAYFGQIFEEKLRDKEKAKDAFKPAAPRPRPVVASGQAPSTAEDEAREEQIEKGLEIARARTLTWAFAYYLLKEKPESVIRYIHDLDAMPRDIELDRDTLLRLFGRAFEVMDRNDPNVIDENLMGNLARTAYQFVKLLPPPREALDSSKKEPKPTKKAKPTKP